MAETDITPDILQKTAEEIEKKLPEKLKMLRLRAGMTTQEAGRALNKTPSAVTMWETGRAVPDILTLFKLRTLYNIGDISEFFDEIPAVELKTLSKSEQDLIISWRNAPSDVRSAVKTILKHICF